MRTRLIYRGTFQAEQPPLEKHEVCRNSRECRNIGKFKQRVAKIGLPIFHSYAFQFGSMNLTGVPVIHCYIAHGSKHNGLECQPIYYVTCFCGSGIWSGLSWLSGLFHMVSTKVTWWYWDGRWATMEDPRGSLLLFKLKCGSPWDCPLEYVHAMSLRSELKWGGGNCPPYRLLKLAQCSFPLSLLVKQVIDAIRLHLAIGWKAENSHPFFHGLHVGSVELGPRGQGPSHVCLCVPSTYHHYTAWGPIFKLVEIQSHPKLTSEAMERELHFTEYQLLFHMFNLSIFSKWLHAVGFISSFYYWRQ